MALKVFNFCCENDHTFEAMVASVADFEKQRAQGLFLCPICGSGNVNRVLSAPHVQTGRSENTVQEMSKVMDMIQEALKQSEDVGQQFADEARAIHTGKAPERMIHGQATPHQIEELLEDGIPVVPLPSRPEVT